jgi:hypothetical protein
MFPSRARGVSATAVMLDAVRVAAATAGSPIYDSRQIWEMDWLRCSD